MSTHTRRRLRVLGEMADKYWNSAIGFGNSAERRHLAEYQYHCHDALIDAVRLMELEAKRTATQNVVEAVRAPLDIERPAE